MKRPLRVRVRIPVDEIRWARDPYWETRRAFQLLSEAGAPVFYGNGAVYPETGSGLRLERICDPEALMVEYRASWLGAPRLPEAEVEVIDVEIVEDRPALPAGA